MIGDASHIHCFRVEGLVPGGVKPTHSGRKICSAAVLGGDVPRVLRNAVVHTVNGFDEFLRSSLVSSRFTRTCWKGEHLVELQPERFNSRIFQLQTKSARDDFLAEVSAR